MCGPEAGPHAALLTSRMRLVYGRRMRLPVARTCAGHTISLIKSMRPPDQISWHGIPVTMGPAKGPGVGW
jgi:hypothetical protein